MKIAIFLNNDIHSATALELMFQTLKNHQVKIILSQKVGNVENLPREIIEMKKAEQNFDQEIFDKIANFFGQKVEVPANVNSQDFLQNIKNFSPDLIISIRFGQIFKPPLIGVAKHGVLNLHSGILPNYRGILASFWAILNGEKEIGTTLHFIQDSGIDTGDIIAFSRKKIDFNSSLISNINSLYEGGCELILRALNQLEKMEKIEVVKQIELGAGGYFSYPKSEDVQKFLKVMRLSDFG